MDLWLSPETGLFGLFAASFLAATLLPGGSEAVLLGLLALHPELHWSALGIATLGNTLGGLSSYALARLLPDAALKKFEGKHQALVQRWGAPILILGWVPLIGDLLCVAAGWLRLPWLPCTLWLALGKGLRYVVLVEGWRWLVG